MTDFPYEDTQKPFRRSHSDEDLNLPRTSEVEFERARGVSHVVNRPDYVEVVVSNLPSPYMESRLEAMRQIKDLAINIDFLKFTVDGMSFVVKNSDWPKFEEEPLNKLSLRAGHNRSVLLVYAVNMRDEEGLVARIVSLVIAAGVEIFHMGDMHDRLLMVIDSAKAELAVSALQEVYPEVTVSDSV